MAASDILDAIADAVPNSYNERVRKFSVNDSYRTVSWVFSAINLLGDSMSGIEFFFGRKSNIDGKVIRLEDTKEPVVYCFYPPSWPDIPTISEMIKMHVIDLSLFGEAFLRLIKKGKYPVEIQVIHPPNISPITSADGKKLKAWKVKTTTPGGQNYEEVVPAEDIVQWKYVNPYSKYRGLAPLTSARLAIEQDLNMAIWNAGFFQNGIRNPIALMLKQTFNDRQRKEYMERLKANFSGFVKGQLPLLVEGGVGVQVLQNTMKDLDFIQGKDATREEITAIFGTPPALVGIYRYAATYSVKEQIKMFYRNTLRPKMVYYRDVFQQTVLDIYFPGVICDWEWESVEEFRNDPVEDANVQSVIASTAKTYFDMGYTKSEIAVILKRPELDPAAHTELTPKPAEIPEPEVPKYVSAPRHSVSKTHQVVYTSNEFLTDYVRGVADGPVRIAAQRTNQFVKVFLGQLSDKVGKPGAKVNRTFWIEQWSKVAEPVQKVFMEGVRSAYRDLRLDEPDTCPEALLPLQTSMVDKLLEFGQALLGSMKAGTNQAQLKESLTRIQSEIPSEVLAWRSFNLGRSAALRLLGVEEIKWCAGDDEHKTMHGSVLDFDTKDLQVASRNEPAPTKSHPCACTVYPVSRKRDTDLVKIRT